MSDEWMLVVLVATFLWLLKGSVFRSAGRQVYACSKLVSPASRKSCRDRLQRRFRVIEMPVAPTGARGRKHSCNCPFAHACSGNGVDVPDRELAGHTDRRAERRG